MSDLTLIWAQSSSGVIGRGNSIPWHVPEDMARFKELTMGHTVIMGRTTWESLPARFRPLPGRRNVVLTRHADYVADGAEVVSSLEDAPLDDEAEGDPDESATVSPITKRPVAKTRPFDGVKRATAPQRTERATDAKPDRADKGAA